MCWRKGDFDWNGKVENWTIIKSSLGSRHWSHRWRYLPYRLHDCIRVFTLLLADWNHILALDWLMYQLMGEQSHFEVRKYVAILCIGNTENSRVRRSVKIHTYLVKHRHYRSTMWWSSPLSGTLIATNNFLRHLYLQSKVPDHCESIQSKVFMKDEKYSHWRKIKGVRQINQSHIKFDVKKIRHIF